jgi:pyridoxal phosphate enzyme (YggS family)
MHLIKNYNLINKSIQSHSRKVTLIVVTKKQEISKITSLIEANHFNYGENRVQDAVLKWKNLILGNPKLKLHLIGKLQSNKARDAFEIFHYIHTLDNEKLAEIFAKLENGSKKKIKYFIQVNIGNESQKSGIPIEKVSKFIEYCINDLNLNIIGLMCIPPVDCDPDKYFISLAEIARQHNLKELSMGMSSDYECAIKNGATFVRIGSKIFSEN